MDFQEEVIPRSNDMLEKLHVDAAVMLQANLQHLGDEFALFCGEQVASAIMRGMLLELSGSPQNRTALEARYDEIGRREFLEEESKASLDFVELTGIVRDAAEYGGQGIAPGERPDRPASLVDRKERIRALHAKVRALHDKGSLLLGTSFDHLWRAARARYALDFGGRIAVEDLALLSQLPITAVRNAISIGQLHPDEAGTIAWEEGGSWLPRRREFCESRWRNLADNQWPFDPAHVAAEDERGMIWVPQAADGTAFTPDRVVRPARSTDGISITIGAKGEERQYSDFYDALTTLAAMSVARWRRRNSEGHWSIVRARGAWVAVSKVEIDRQLAEKLAEVV